MLSSPPLIVLMYAGLQCYAISIHSTLFYVLLLYLCAILNFDKKAECTSFHYRHKVRIYYEKGLLFSNEQNMRLKFLKKSPTQRTFLDTPLSNSAQIWAIYSSDMRQNAQNWLQIFKIFLGGEPPRPSLKSSARAGQIRRSVANSSPPLQHSFCVAQAHSRGDAPRQLVSRYTLRRIPASIMKI